MHHEPKSGAHLYQMLDQHDTRLRNLDIRLDTSPDRGVEASPGGCCWLRVGITCTRRQDSGRESRTSFRTSLRGGRGTSAAWRIPPLRLQPLPLVEKDRARYERRQ